LRIRALAGAGNTPVLDDDHRFARGLAGRRVEETVSVDSANHEGMLVPNFS
jgi:hypothetical protein